MMIKKSNGKRGEHVAIMKIIQFILIALVIVFVAILVVRFGLLQRLGIFPDYNDGGGFYGNGGSCPEGMGEVAKLDKDYYIVVNGKRTNIYLQPKENLIRLDNSGVDEMLGEITNTGGVFVLTFDREFLDVNSQKFYQYREIMPMESSARHFLFASQISGNILCNRANVGKDAEKIKECNKESEDCKLFNGICSSTPIEGKIAIGKAGNLGCLSGETCYASESEEVLGEGISILEFRAVSFNFYESAGERIDILNDKPSYLTSYPGEKWTFQITVKSNKDFCYSIDSNSAYLDVGFKESSDSLFYNFDKFYYNGEKFIEFVAWNDDTKVIKRIRLQKANAPEIFADGSYIKDDKFKETIESAGEGAVFYILGITHNWGGDDSILYTHNYKIIKTGNRVSIYAYDVLEKKWHELDCSRKNMFYASIAISDLKATLSETLGNDLCKWGWLR